MDTGIGDIVEVIHTDGGVKRRGYVAQIDADEGVISVRVRYVWLEEQWVARDYTVEVDCEEVRFVGAPLSREITEPAINFLMASDPRNELIRR